MSSSKLNLILQPYANTPPNSKYPLNLVLLESSDPWLPMHPFELFTQAFDATSSKRTPFDFKNG